MQMRKTVFVLLLAVIAVGALECTSSYVLFRHYSRLNKSFHPAGSSTSLLLKHLYARFIEGRHEVVELSINHGHVFRANDVLGFLMNPGSYEITEDFDSQRHRFQLTVDGMGRRITSYMPVDATRRIYVTGDSAMFGWGLDDEQTAPWLLQTRLPHYQVVNLSLTGYSTIQTLLKLKQIISKFSADDILILTHHRGDNESNVVSPEVLADLSSGFEEQLGDENFIRTVAIPYGLIDAKGNLAIRRIHLSCFRHTLAPGCVRSAANASEAMEVTIRAFDEIIAMCPGHVVVAFLSGDDDDPVIQHLRSKAVTIVDLRASKDDPDVDDLVATDNHPGPFLHHRFYVGLVNALLRNHLVN